MILDSPLGRAIYRFERSVDETTRDRVPLPPCESDVPMRAPESPRAEVLTTPAEGVWALVLAAGRGTRFGGGKLMAPLGGRPLIAHVLAAAADARTRGILSGTVAVVPVRDDAIARTVLDGGAEVAVNPEPSVGLSRSLRLGFAALEAKGPAVRAAVILPGDQPLVRVEAIAAVVAVWRKQGAAVVRPVYRDQPEVPGHPVLLDRTAWPLTLELTGEEGLGALLRRRPELITTVDLPGSNPEVDTPGDLADLEDPTQ